MEPGVGLQGEARGGAAGWGCRVDPGVGLQGGAGGGTCCRRIVSLGVQEGTAGIVVDSAQMMQAS